MHMNVLAQKQTRPKDTQHALRLEEGQGAKEDFVFCACLCVYF